MNSVFTVFFIAAAVASAFAQSVLVDPSFDPGAGADGTVRTSFIQSDGKIFIGGEFNFYDTNLINGIARLNVDGSLDGTFNTGLGVNGDIYTSSILGDGKIIIGGSFSEYNGTNSNNIACLNPDGSLDETFNPGTGSSSAVFSISIQTDEKVLIAGGFSEYDGVPRSQVARINSDGSLDSSFDPGLGADNTVQTIAYQNNGKIIIGGAFNFYNGISSNHIARLNPDGTLDDSFEIGEGPNSLVWSTAAQSDGKIIIGGSFTSYNGITRNNLARLNADGTLDETFDPEIGGNNDIWTVALLDTGKILVGGNFESWNDVEIGGFIRLNEDGTLDESFDQGAGANDYVYAISVQSDNKIIIGGQFTSYDGTLRIRIARLIEETTTGLNSISRDKNLIIYPNPSAYYCWIQTDFSELVSIEIIDIQSRLVRTERVSISALENLRLDLSPLEVGTYFLNFVRTSDGFLLGTEKLIVVR